MQESYDVCRLRIEFDGDETPWMYPLALNGRSIQGVFVDGERYERVVRCRDCKHHHEGECMLTDGMGDFKRLLVDDDDYCSDGERAVGA